MWTAYAVALLAARNVAGDTLVPRALYVPVNLTLTATIGLIAWRARVSAADAGLARRSAGVRVGALIAGVVASVLAAAAVLPWTRPLFEDRRLAGVDGVGELAYESLVRIPLGTVVLEEVAFRGVLPALFARRRSTLTAVLISSALFGLWHIRPTLSALDTNDLGGGVAGQALLTAGAVAATTVAGILFCMLRLATGSVLAPMLVHTATNSSAAVAAYVVLRGGG